MGAYRNDRRKKIKMLQKQKTKIKKLQLKMLQKIKCFSILGHMLKISHLILIKYNGRKNMRKTLYLSKILKILLDLLSFCKIFFKFVAVADEIFIKCH